MNDKILKQSLKTVYLLGQLYKVSDNEQIMKLMREAYVQGLADGIQMAIEIKKENDKEILF
mgnify:CR=1 FL=1